MLRSLIYSFHMPVFFIISGYLFKPKSASRFIVPILLPVMFCSTIAIVEHLLFRNLVWGGEMNWRTTISGFLASFWRGKMPGWSKPIRTFTGFWFVISWIGCCMILSIPAIGKRWKTMASVSFILATVLTAIRHPFYLRSLHAFKIVTAMPFMCFGIGLRQIAHKRGIPELKVPVPIGLRRFIPAVCWLVVTILNGDADMAGNDFGAYGYPAFFVGGIAGALFLFQACNHLPQSPFFETFSVGTLLVMGLHWPFLVFVLPLMRRMPFRFLNSSACFAFCASIPVLALCYLSIILSQKICPALLGKNSVTAFSRRNIKNSDVE